VSFEKQYLKKQEHFVLKVYEQGNSRPLILKDVPVEAK
jgi:hypothetical protein